MVLLSSKTGAKLAKYLKEASKTWTFLLANTSIITPQTGHFAVLLDFWWYFRCRNFCTRICPRGIRIFRGGWFSWNFVRFCWVLLDFVTYREQKNSCTAKVHAWSPVSGASPMSVAMMDHTPGELCSIYVSVPRQNNLKSWKIAQLIRIFCVYLSPTRRVFRV